MSVAVEIIDVRAGSSVVRVEPFATPAEALRFVEQRAHLWGRHGHFAAVLRRLVLR